MQRRRYFYEWYTSNGYVEGFLLTKEFKRVDGVKLNKDEIFFGDWTGRWFYLGVNW